MARLHVSLARLDCSKDGMAAEFRDTSLEGHSPVGLFSWNNKHIMQCPLNKDPRTSSDWNLAGRAGACSVDCVL